MKNKLLPVVMALIMTLFLLVPAASASGSVPVLLDGNDISREIGLSLQDGVSWVKLRPLVEQLGWDVVWNGQTGTVRLVRNHNQELAAVVGADNLNPLHAVALKAAEIAMAQSGLSGVSDLLVLTNAGYAEVNQSDSGCCLDALTAATGCTPGRGDLLQVHSACTASLYFFFFDRHTGNAAYLAVNPISLNRQKGPQGFQAVLKLDQQNLFSHIANANAGADSILTDQAAWSKKVAEKIFDGREFALVTIANMVADGAPPELVRSALFHDHLCPGVSAGYLIARSLLEELPLQAGQG